MRVYVFAGSCMVTPGAITRLDPALHPRTSANTTFPSRDAAAQHPPLGQASPLPAPGSRLTRLPFSPNGPRGPGNPTEPCAERIREKRWQRDRQNWLLASPFEASSGHQFQRLSWVPPALTSSKATLCPLFQFSLPTLAAPSHSGLQSVSQYTDMLLPQDLCTGGSLVLKCFPPRSPQSQLII